VPLKNRRSTSRLPALVDLLLSEPLISVPLAAKELKVSPPAVEGLIRELGATPRELTGRGRFGRGAASRLEMLPSRDGDRHCCCDPIG